MVTEMEPLQQHDIRIRTQWTLWSRDSPTGYNFEPLLGPLGIKLC